MSERYKPDEAAHSVIVGKTTFVANSFTDPWNYNKKFWHSICKNGDGEVIAYSKFNNMEKKHGSSPSKIIDVVYALVRKRKIPVTDQI